MNQKTFISYSRADGEFVRRLIDDLIKRGVNVWLDQRNIAAGQRWDDIIEQAIQECDTFVIVLSPTSVASENVRDEISCAIGANKRIIPILYKDCQVPFRIARIQYIDFKGEHGSALQHLIAEIQGLPHTQPIQAKKKSRVGVTILGIIFGCLFLAALLAGGYWVYDNVIAGKTIPTETRRPTTDPTKAPTEAPPATAPTLVPTEINPGLPPTGEYLTLDENFKNDPQLVFFKSGGPVNLSYLNDIRTGSPCNGFSSEAPNVVVNMIVNNPGLTLKFLYKTNDNSYATLLIEYPNGAPFCPPAATQPEWIIYEAPSGEYKIWIGAFGNNDQDGILYITHDEFFYP